MGNTKLDEMATCPYCGYEDGYVFHYGTDTLRCHECGKEFAIKLEMTIEVKSAKLYNKRCIDCGVPLYDEELIGGTCPNCGGVRFYEKSVALTGSEFEVTDRSHWDYFRLNYDYS